MNPVLKSSFFLLVSGLLLAACQSSPKEEPEVKMPPARKYLSKDWESYDVKGKVKEVMEFSYPVKVLKDKRVMKDGDEPEARTLTRFNEQGQILNVSHYVPAQDSFPGMVYYSEIRTYSEGKLREARTFRKPELAPEDYGKELAVDFLDRDEEWFDAHLLMKVKFHYPEKKERRDSLFSCKGYEVRLELITIAELNANGDILKETGWTPGEADPVMIAEYRYNKKNQLVYESIWTKVGGDLESKDCKLFDNGVVEAVELCVGSQCRIEVFEYNSMGNIGIIKAEGKNQQFEEIRRYRYVYDPRENWTKKTVFGDGSPYVVEREIEYY